MNTTTTTFRSKKIPYTVLGGISSDKNQNEISKISIILLNRGGRFYRETLLSELDSMHYIETIYIEGPEISYDIEPLARKFSQIKFLLMHSKISIGEKINIGLDEAKNNFVLIMWSDMQIIYINNLFVIIEKMKKNNNVCTIPILKTAQNTIIPSIQVPALIKKSLDIVPWNPEKDNSPSIFPFDYCGIYNKRKYFSLEGYDEKITNPYWQRMDFGFRSFMWGEIFLLDKSFILKYNADTQPEDTTPDSSYKLFYLKNFLLHIKNGMGFLSILKVFSYILNSDSGPFHSFKEFSRIQGWIKENRMRFKKDAKTIINFWEVLE